MDLSWFKSHRLDSQGSFAEAYNIVAAALDACSLSKEYLFSFKARKLDDLVLSECMGDPKQMRKHVSSAIDSLGDQTKFVSAFREQLNSSSQLHPSYYPPSSAASTLNRHVPVHLQSDLEKQECQSSSSSKPYLEKPNLAHSFPRNKSTNVVIPEQLSEEIRRPPNIAHDGNQFFRRSSCSQPRIKQPNLIHEGQHSFKNPLRINQKSMSQPAPPFQEPASKDEVIDVKPVISQAIKYYKKQSVAAVDSSYDEDDLKEKLTSIGKKAKECLLCKLGSNELHLAVLQEWDDLVKKTEKNVWETFHLKQKVDDEDIRPVMNTLKRRYKSDMEIIFQGHTWVNPAHLQQEHERLVERLLDEARAKKMFKSNHLKTLSDTLNGLFKRYKDDNLALIPTKHPAIGIDLGTTYSCVAIYENRKLEIIPDQGSSTVPSIVAFDNHRQILVGEAAKDGLIRYPEETVYDAKRLIGRHFNEPEIQNDMKYWPFVVKEENNQPRFQCREKLYRPEEISAKVLYRLKQMASDHLGRPVTDAVVTVPAHFGSAQREATRSAAELAGLNVSLLTEPVAAAVAYSLHRQDDKERNVLVYDLGGGTFDVAVIQIKHGNFTELAIDGDTHLGGEDFDNYIVKYFTEVIKHEHRVDLIKQKNSTDADVRRKTNSLLRRIRKECEEKKRRLSYNNVREVDIIIEDGSRTFEVTLNRIGFERMILHDLERTIEIMARCLKTSKLTIHEIHDVVLVGGSTNIPKVKELVSKFFDGRVLRQTVKPEEAVAQGAAFIAAREVAKKGKIITSVAPSSIGIEKENGGFEVQIQKNQVLPISKTSTWENAKDDQTKSEYNIYEGESTVAKNNEFLGMFVLTGIPAMKKGKAKKEITMTLNQEGILHVKAVCLINGVSEEITIKKDHGTLCREELHSIAGADIMRW